MGRSPRPQTPFEVGLGAEGDDPIGQHDCGVVYQQAGGNTECLPMQGSDQGVGMVQPQRDLSGGSAPTGPGQYHRRRIIPPLPARQFREHGEGVVSRLVSRSLSLQTDIPQNGTPTRGPVCGQGQSPAAGILCQGQGPGGDGGRRAVPELGRRDRVCVPANSPHPQGTDQGGSDRRLFGPPGSPMVAAAAVVCDTHRPTRSGAGIATRATRPPCRPGPSHGDPVTHNSVSPPDCLDLFKQSFEAAGFSAEAALLAGKARRPSTSQTYNNRLSKIRQMVQEWQGVSVHCLYREGGGLPSPHLRHRRSGADGAGIPHSDRGSAPRVSRWFICCQQRKSV